VVSLPESALEYSIAAGDVDTVADLTGRLVLPTYQQGRVTTVQRWFRWLQDRGGVMQMRADADEAVRRFAAEGIKAPIASLCQGLARILSGDLDGGDASLTLVCAVAARVAVRRGEVQTARQLLISAQRTRFLLTYAFPHMAVQARIELIASIWPSAI
jgi:hypothetical protein